MPARISIDSRSQARAAAIALALLALAALYAALVHPLVTAHRALDARLASLQAELASLSRLAAGREEAERRLEAMKRNDAARRHYLAERTPSLAAAELQRLLRRAAEQGQGELVSTEVPGGQRPEAEVMVRARVRGDTATLQRMLHALEAGPPILFVQDLSVDVARGLVISLDVSGYMRAPEGLVSVSQRKVLEGKSDARKDLKLSFPPLEAFAEVVERTLFEPSRRPSRQGGVVAGRVADAGALALVGVVIGPEGPLALLRDGASPAERLAPGASLGDWVVEEVRSDGVRLRRGGETRELLLHVKELP